MLEINKPYKNIIVTGGSGFIGTNLIKKLLQEPDVNVINLDKQKSTYISEFKKYSYKKTNRYQYLKIDLSDSESTISAVKKVNPDLIIHLAAESHVDRSITSPFDFVQSNILGTFNLLQASLSHWKSLSKDRKNNFRFHHVSTDEVYGSLMLNEFSSENSKYSPNSPYSASKAASDHLVNAWFKTYDLPVVTSHCSNNYGPWQFPEKLIPLVINKAINLESIPIYGKGNNIRDWLYVEDHVDAILLIAKTGKLGETYCIGGNNEKTNREIVMEICNELDLIRPRNNKYASLITYVKDRPGHDMRYAIDSSKIKKDLGWCPKYNFEEGIKNTINWYLKNINWCKKVLKEADYNCERLGLL